MKDIGASFKEKREEIGISKEEICADLEITEAQLDNLEDGNANAFKDIFFLKETIKKYAKYLNLDEDVIMSEFNDFVFNFTSKIPINEIEEKVKEIKEEDKENKIKVISPYTKRKDTETKRRTLLIWICSIILVVALICLVIIFIKKSLGI